MDARTFDAIVAKIEAPLQGDGYTVRVRTASGQTIEGAWHARLECGVAIDRTGNPRRLRYVALAAIESIEQVED